MTEANSKVMAKAMQSKTEIFIQKAIAVHGGRYDYSKVAYIVSKSKVIIGCPEHGDFEKRPDHHLAGQGCLKCTGLAKLTVKEFISKAKLVHGNLYDYSQVKYINSYTKVKIICSTHGVFEQRPNDHLKAYGCSECSKNLNAYSLSVYVKTCKKYDGHSSLYVVRLSNENESFFKVGITVNAKNRFREYTKAGYACEVITAIRDKAGYIWNLEKRLHFILKQWRYKPKIDFGGQTECFSQIPKLVCRLLDDIQQSMQMQLMT